MTESSTHACGCLRCRSNAPSDRNVVSRPFALFAILFATAGLALP